MRASIVRAVLPRAPRWPPARDALNGKMQEITDAVASRTIIKRVRRRVPVASVTCVLKGNKFANLYCAFVASALASAF